MTTDALRNHIVSLLRDGAAHCSVTAALDKLDRKSRNRRPHAELHTVWEELEHMRLAQEDILRYTLDPAWKSPKFPDGYWPQGDATDPMWDSTLYRFFNDLEETIALVENIDIDLYAQIPHGGDHTYLREVLLIADHNAYHTGQIVAVRKMLSDWK